MMEVRNSQLTEAMRERAEEQADSARQELGEIVTDATGRYFPEAVRERRRRDVAAGFLAGVVFGFVLRYAVGER